MAYIAIGGSHGRTNSLPLLTNQSFDATHSASFYGQDVPNGTLAWMIVATEVGRPRQVFLSVAEHQVELTAQAVILNSSFGLQQARACVERMYGSCMACHDACFYVKLISADTV